MDNCYFDQYYYGTIEKVFAPGDPLNKNKYQYEYRVIITARNYSQVPIRCIRNDPSCGNINGFDDEILAIGYRVFVLCPLGDQSCGVIIGGSRAHPVKQSGDGVYSLRRFNQVETATTADSVWSVSYRATPGGVATASIVMDKNNIKIGDNAADSQQDYIELDNDSHTITINAGTWAVKVSNDANITIQGDCNITCNNLNATVQGDATVSAASLEADIQGDVDITAAGAASITASVVQLNGPGGGVVTTLTHPVDYITGLPILGSLTVTAGE